MRNNEKKKKSNIPQPSLAVFTNALESQAAITSKPLEFKKVKLKTITITAYISLIDCVRV